MSILIPTENGKAFEFACVDALSRFINSQGRGIDAVILDNSSLQIARGNFESVKLMNSAHAADLVLAGEKLSQILFQTEPRLFNVQKNYKKQIILSIQPDALGKTGDVRDILVVKEVSVDKKFWEIGISCKHNHDAIKHPRVSPTIDFGEMWMGAPLQNNDYFILNEIFNGVDDEKINGVINWSDVDNKEDKFYIPILDLIADKIRRHPQKEILAEHLLQYLIGTQDFYKLIYTEVNKTIHIQGFNFNGTLNDPADAVRPILTVHKLHFPERIIDVGYKPQSKNTLEIFFDKGWQVSLRVHNASTKIEKSLKMDVRLDGMPHEMFNFSSSL